MALQNIWQEFYKESENMRPGKRRPYDYKFLRRTSIEEAKHRYIMFGLLLKCLFLAIVAKQCAGQEQKDNTTLKPDIPCCVAGTMKFDLSSQSYIPRNVANMEVIYDRTSRPNRKCSREIVVKANFEKTKCGCRVPPDCGRKMLRIDMDISYNRGSYLFAMGDSVSNDGWGGDGSDQQNDAELFGYGDFFFLFKGDKCLANSSYTTLFSGSLTPDVFNHVTVFVSNEHIRFITDFGQVDEQVCHRCLYALAGQSDSSSGGINEDVFVSFNRMIRTSSGRIGFGVCTASIQWVCPYTFNN
ncbi:uncharacterized protein LOC117332108 [Pecten maximus]|uniref:uncharacterized protein LOC117332108 n=1 Tax=Pecten maximus TaxID=6579 RepID=UPI0014582703|nr:uncharacterized protein LOC117332108 [Pecten maximus]